MDKRILDATCGSRQIWFQKQEPHTIYCDQRREEHAEYHKRLIIDPDIICDFTNLPFEDESFYLVVFDPPHVLDLKETAWMRKEYGTLNRNDWKDVIGSGFRECMRVLKPNGVLIFKWSDISISTRDVINVIGQEPLFGHRSGRKMNTHWMCFMKGLDDGQNG